MKAADAATGGARALRAGLLAREELSVDACDCCAVRRCSGGGDEWSGACGAVVATVPAS